MGDSAIRAVCDVCRREEVATAHAAARARSAQLTAQAEKAATALRIAQEQAEEARRLAAAAQEQEQATQAEMEALTSSVMDAKPAEFPMPSALDQALARVNEARASSASAEPMESIGGRSLVSSVGRVPTVAASSSPGQSQPKGKELASSKLPIAAAGPVAVEGVRDMDEVKEEDDSTAFASNSSSAAAAAARMRMACHRKRLGTLAQGGNTVFPCCFRV
jgi:hypothetical protein